MPADDEARPLAGPQGSSGGCVGGVSGSPCAGREPRKVLHRYLSRGMGGAKNICLVNPPAWACAGGGAGGPGQVQHWKEETTPGAGRRSPTSLPAGARQRENGARRIPLCDKGVNPGGPGGHSAPGNPELHPPHRRERIGPGRFGGVHPGWPGWPRPPGDPGSHHIVHHQVDCPWNPDGVRPGWPGRLRPPRKSRAAPSPTT